MRADPRDDFAAFAGHEEMFYGLPEPYVQLRAEIRGGLRRQVPDAEVDCIAVTAPPRHITAGRELDGGRRLAVTAFAVMFRARITARSAAAKRVDELDATVTVMYGRLDQPGAQTSRTYFDLHADAARCFDDEILKQRFVDFHGDGDDDDPRTS